MEDTGTTSSNRMFLRAHCVLKMVRKIWCCLLQATGTKGITCFYIFAVGENKRNSICHKLGTGSRGGPRVTNLVSNGMLRDAWRTCPPATGLCVERREDKEKQKWSVWESDRANTRRISSLQETSWQEETRSWSSHRSLTMSDCEGPPTGEQKAVCVCACECLCVCVCAYLRPHACFNSSLSSTETAHSASILRELVVFGSLYGAPGLRTHQK